MFEKLHQNAFFNVIMILFGFISNCIGLANLMFVNDNSANGNSNESVSNIPKEFFYLLCIYGIFIITWFMILLLFKWYTYKRRKGEMGFSWLNVFIKGLIFSVLFIHIPSFLFLINFNLSFDAFKALTMLSPIYLALIGFMLYGFMPVIYPIMQDYFEESRSE